jgi:NAD(P)-dependent dehydrogenase (short-subunit alcohol dehydrogenase family)
MKTLRGKQVLVTGAAAGIGLECARSFARQGANLVISDVNAAALDDARREIVGLGVSCIAQVCDVTSESSVAAFAAAVQAAVGPIDVLVNNAGVAYLGSFEETPIEQWRRIVDVNVLGIARPAPRRRTAAGPISTPTLKNSSASRDVPAAAPPRRARPRSPARAAGRRRTRPATDGSAA